MCDNYTKIFLLSRVATSNIFQEFTIYFMKDLEQSSYINIHRRDTIFDNVNSLRKIYVLELHVPHRSILLTALR